MGSSNVDSDDWYHYVPKHRATHDSDFAEPEDNFNALTHHIQQTGINVPISMGPFDDPEHAADYFLQIASGARNAAREATKAGFPEHAHHFSEASHRAHALGQELLSSNGLVDGSDQFLLHTSPEGERSLHYNAGGSSLASSAMAHNLALIMATSKRGHR